MTGQRRRRTIRIDTEGKGTVGRQRTDTSRSTIGRHRESNAKFVARRQEIVDLSAKLFAANGYAATGIREIGEAARLARGALYYYIGSKESLLGDIHDRVMDPLLRETASITELPDSSSVRLRLISEVLLRQIVEHHDHVWVFLHEYRSLTGARRATFRKKRDQFEGLITDLLAEGVEAGEFVIADLRLTMLAFLGMHNYTYQWIKRSDAVDPAMLSNVYCTVFFSGITSAANDGVSAAV